MFDIIPYLWLILGGLLEPLWVIGMKKSDNFKRRGYAVLTIFLIVASPYCLSVAMQTIPIGTAYAVWTGIGAVGAVLAGLVLYKEKMNLIRIVLILFIITGVTGLALLEGI